MTQQNPVVLAAAQVCVVANFEGGSGRAPRPRTMVEQQLSNLQECLASGDLDRAGDSLEYLRTILQPSSGQKPRASSGGGQVGGVQYRSTYMLDCVLLSDNLRSIHASEPDLLATVVKQSLSVCLHEDLYAHLSKWQLRLPKKSVLYDWRRNIDFCCMLYAREFVFPVVPAGAVGARCTHFRLDSSPQFSRDYLVGELDRLSLHAISFETDADIDRVRVG